MIKFRMTKKAQKQLGYTKSSEGNEVERFHSWHVNSFNVSRRIGMILVSNRITINFFWISI